MIGRVVSSKTKGTAIVLVERVSKHPLYKKTFLRSKRFQVHVTEDIKDGDIVEFMKIKPISKNKHWKIFKVIGKNLAEIVEAKQKEVAEKIIAEVMPEEKEKPREPEIETVPDEKVVKETKKRSKASLTLSDKK